MGKGPGGLCGANLAFIPILEEVVLGSQALTPRKMGGWEEKKGIVLTLRTLIPC